jgi:hypothetical protein
MPAGFSLLKVHAIGMRGEPMRQIATSIAIIVLLFQPAVMAREVAGVKIADTVALQGNDLALVGAGVRSRFFIKVYVGALYLPSTKPENANRVLMQEGPKSVRLHFLHKALSADQLVEAWNDGFTGNNTPEQLARLKPRIELFNAMFPAVKRGDTIQLNLLTTGRTEVWVNDSMRGAISGPDFQQALLKICLGEKPADPSLKRAMLGD